MNSIKKRNNVKNDYDRMDIGSNMNILIINGSARKEGFCNYISNNLCSSLLSLNNNIKKINVKYYNIPSKNIEFCRGCVQCCANEHKYCFIDDDIQSAYKLMEEADSIVYISPIYESFISGILKNFFDRTNHYTSFFKLAGKNINLILSGVQPLYGETKEFSNIHVIKNINRYFMNYSIITHTRYNYLGFFNHLNHHSVKNENEEEQFQCQISKIAKRIVKQKIDHDMIKNSQKPYTV